MQDCSVIVDRGEMRPVPRKEMLYSIYGVVNRVSGGVEVVDVTSCRPGPPTDGATGDAGYFSLHFSTHIL